MPNDLDYSEIMPLRARLPSLVLNSTEDQLFTMPEMERADAIMRDVYARAGGGDRYQCSLYPGPHKLDREMQAEAFDWFDRWLRA